MAMTRVTERGQKSPADEEFLQQLYRGGELLAQGKVLEARQLLERAHELQPRNEKGRSLLGLAYFKLGLFDRAAELYEALVRDNPVDATLRVNLGLVYLKTNALQRAMREFEAATDLQPDHKKAHNYLGLAQAQAGAYGRAREHFLKAGSDVMAEKMARAIAGEKFDKPSRPAPTPVPVSGAVSTSEPLPESLEEATPELPAKVMTLRSGEEVLAGASQASPFRVDNGGFCARVEGELLTRLEGLVAFTGQLQFQPEMRRSQGRPTDQPFGEGAGRLVRVSGRGMLLLEPAQSRSFRVVDPGEEGAWLREEYLFALEASVAFENGQVLSDVAPDLELVHLSGQGRVLLSLTGRLRSVAVVEEAPVTVPLSHLVGWQGKLLPRVVPLPTAGSEPPWSAVELSGEGFALIALPVR